MSISINVMKQGTHLLVAACDLNLLGKTLKFGKVKFDISKHFYGGSCVSVDEAVQMIRDGTNVNIVGPIIVRKAIEEGLIHPKAVIEISGIPHAQIMKV